MAPSGGGEKKSTVSITMKNTKQHKREQKRNGGHLAEADADGALQLPAGGGRLLQLAQGEAEAGAVGAGVRGAGLRHERQVLHHGEGALGAHQAPHHFDGEDGAPQCLEPNLRATHTHKKTDESHARHYAARLSAPLRDNQGEMNAHVFKEFNIKRNAAVTMQQGPVPNCTCKVPTNSPHGSRIGLDVGVIKCVVCHSV